MMQQQYGVIVTIAQVVPEWSKPEQVARIFEQLLWVVKEVFIQHNHAVNDFPTIEQTSGGGSDKQVNTRMGIGLTQGAQCRCSQKQVTDCCQLHDKYMSIWWKNNLSRMHTRL